MNDMQSLKSELNCGYYGKLVEYDLLKPFPNENSGIIIYKIHIPEFINILDELLSFLDLKEIDRAAKFYKEKDKYRFVICRSLLKFILSLHAKVDIKQIKIDYQTPNKKPYLSSHPSFFFNVTHSHDVGLIAVANRPIGIDIEHIDGNYEFMNLLEHFCNEKEMSFIKNATNKEQAFYSIWTRKESFVKALGTGINNDFSKMPSIDGLHFVDSSLVGGKIKNWQIQGFDLTDEYIGALAYETKETYSQKITIYTLPNKIDELIGLQQF